MRTTTEDIINPAFRKVLQPAIQAYRHIAARPPSRRKPTTIPAVSLPKTQTAQFPKARPQRGNAPGCLEGGGLRFGLRLFFNRLLGHRAVVRGDQFPDNLPKVGERFTTVKQRLVNI